MNSIEVSDSSVRLITSMQRPVCPLCGIASLSMGECIAYEAFSFGGSSGSPVFAIHNGFPVGGAIQAGENFYRPVMLIGINAGHLVVDGLDRHHAGISYMYKSSVILQIIDR